MIYLLDTNTISDWVTYQPRIVRRIADQLIVGDTLGLCRPIHYEISRGFFWRNATGKLRTYQQRIAPIMTWIELNDSDWEQAAHFWADARRKGRQLGDPDLLVAALAYRLNATLVSADSDFDALPIRREDWRV